MKSISLLLLRFAGLFGLIGAFIGSHMAGSQGGAYALRPIHAHILVVGWLSLFAWSAFYQLFETRFIKLAKTHAWTGIIGTTGLTLGMWLYMVNPFNLAEGFTTVFYIVGGTLLLVSFALFFVLTFLVQPAKRN
ncbi:MULTISPECIES: hypothetical protein [Pontibacillus]|uniref:Cbb3-type cytochrome c oxidase subunit I n=1 Tax=Pontibacillus chungwhensis TaxID=265426 RepID=A0ABY8V0V5_9BACI|nr:MULTISPECIES: hypothetical protein [Pontibacillus]MCD5324901.1 hypothetical protein [Pontibacillus sp. HN14]WIF98862.1 hypothetical protein QNI29_04180 [Pontibacillus chungwhensis]